MRKYVIEIYKENKKVGYLGIDGFATKDKAFAKVCDGELDTALTLNAIQGMFGRAETIAKAIGKR